MSTRHHRAAGFTLIEILVALGIVALALSTGLQAIGALSHSAQRQSDAMLAQLCAENTLIQLRLSRQMPGTGDKQVNCEQAGQHFDVVVATSSTANPNFRRVEVRVQKERSNVLQLSTVVGRF